MLVPHQAAAGDRLPLLFPFSRRPARFPSAAPGTLPGKILLSARNTANNLENTLSFVRRDPIMKELKIRRAQPGDEAALAHIQSQAWQQVFV